MSNRLLLRAVVAVTVLGGPGLLSAGRALATAPDHSAPAPASPSPSRPPKGATPQGAAIGKIMKNETEWKRILTPEQFRVLRQKGTEMAFTGQFWNHHERGVYRCAGCDLELFGSGAKFDSGTGWPSFSVPVAAEHVERSADRSHGMVRNEVLCARCGGHLGHVFDDGPRPTGLRYCINSAALKFDPTK